MTHLPYIVAAYVIAVGVPLFFSIEALFRTRSARRRLAAIDTRRERGRHDPQEAAAAVAAGLRHRPGVRRRADPVGVQRQSGVLRLALRSGQVRAQRAAGAAGRAGGAGHR